MTKLKQDERVFFRISDTVEGYGTVAGDYDLLVILKPETQIGPYTHIYVTKTQIVERDPSNAPVVPQEDAEEYPFATGHDAPPEGKETF